MDQSSLTNKAKAVISGITTAITAAVGYGVLPTGAVQTADLVGSAVLAVITAYFAVRHLLEPTA